MPKKFTCFLIIRKDEWLLVEKKNAFGMFRFLRAYLYRTINVEISLILLETTNFVSFLRCHIGGILVTPAVGSLD